MGRRKAGAAESIERRLPALYFAFALLLTTVLCWTTAPFFGPDEPNQSLRVLALLHGEILPRMGADEAGGEVDSGAVHAMDAMDSIRMHWEPQSPDFHDRKYGPVTAQAQARWAGVRWSGKRSFAGFGNTATYPARLVSAGDGWMEACRDGQSDNLCKLALCTVAHGIQRSSARLVCTASQWVRRMDAAAGIVAAE